MKSIALDRISSPSSRSHADIVVFSLFFLAGVVLMYVGYFYSYSEGYFIGYLFAIVLVGICYVIYFGFIASPQMAVYNWIFMFMIFPKKELRPDMDALLNLGFGFTNAGLSMYNVLDVFVVSAIFAAVVSRRRRSEQIIPSNLRFLHHAYLMMALVGMSHGVLAWFNLEILGDVGYDRMFVSFWPLLSAFVVFQGALKFIHTREQTERVLIIMVFASLLLLAEFFLAKYTSFLPEQIVYYSLNYRKAFRSAIQSGDLFVTQILIAGGAAALYFYLVRKRKLYAAFFILFAYLVLETYNRGSLASIIIMGIIVTANSSLSNRLKLVVLSGAVLASIFYFSYTSGERSLQVVGSLLDLGKVREEGGYFSVDSTFQRIGAIFRGIDVFLYLPFSGSGPGNVISFMTSVLVPGSLGESVLNPSSREFYEMIASGSYPTNPHNLYVTMLAEYGVVAIAAIYATVKSLLSNYRSFKREFGKSGQNGSYSLFCIRLCSFAAIFAYGFYFVFQAVPLIYGLFFLLLRLTVIDDRGWSGKLRRPANVHELPTKREVDRGEYGAVIERKNVRCI